MELFLSKYCRSFTGTLNKSHGYSICRKGNKFFSQRNTRGIVPPDGHLRFIFACAELAREGLLLTNIRIMGSELLDAATEAGYTLETIIADVEYNAHDILNIKTYYGL